MAQATANRDQIYVKLVKRLNQNPVKLPPIEPVLQFVKELFDETQAVLGAAFPMGAHTLPDLAKMMDRDVSDLGILLDQMEAQGLVFSEKPQGIDTRYSLVPFIPGLVEHQFLNGDESPKAIRIAQLYKEITEALGPAAIKSYQKPLPPDADLQVNALKVNEDIARADEAYCVGCGNCIAVCPTQSITLIRCDDYCPPDSSDIGLVGLGR